MTFFTGNIGRKVSRKGGHLVASVCDKVTGKWHDVFFHGEAKREFNENGCGTGDFIRVGINKGKQADNAYYLKILKQKAA